MTSGKRTVDLSHRIYDDMPSYPWTPVPSVSEWVTREQSGEFLAPGVSFHIAQINMAGNSGSYLNAPFQFHIDGPDVASLPLEWLIDIPVVVVEAPDRQEIGPDVFEGYDDLAGKAVLIRTGHDRLWGTKDFFRNSPYLTVDAVKHLIAAEPRIVGIDSQNLDNGKDQSKPAQNGLLGANILVMVSLTHLDQLPERGSALTVLPPPIAGMGSFPIRAVAVVDA